MKKLPELLMPVFRYGAFAKPLIIKIINSNLSDNIRYTALSFVHTWKGDYDKALYYTHKALDLCGNSGMRYMLLARELSCKASLGNKDEKLYQFLKSNLNKISGRTREEIEAVISNVEARWGIAKLKRKTRIWGSKKILPALAFLHLGRARRLAEEGKLPQGVHHYIQAYRLSKNIPHPSGITSSLNGLAWRIREKHPFWAQSIARRAVYYLGYYREIPGNLFGCLDTLFVIEKAINSCSIAQTARVIASLPVPKNYEKLSREAEKFIPNYYISMYENTEELRKYLKTLIGPYRKENVSIAGLSAIFTGKTKVIRGNTLRKIIERITESRNVDITRMPYPVYNELVKHRIEKSFDEAVKYLEKLPFSERKRLFFSTFIALIDREKFYLSRKDKLLETYKSLRGIDTFANLMSKRYETMNFVVDMVKAHPYIEGRKAAIRKAVDRMRIDEFIKHYAKFNEHNRKLLDKFLRNYGRYDGIRFGVRIDGPERVRAFAKRYRLKIQPCFIAYWCEEDGRTRRKLERILEII
ncbi:MULTISPECIES: hypothetical protein [Kosmotoga]|uniref:Tetratricopeptide repeat protein n=1 Tax=Kosmotoga olearia (strain ATCC BAA-1733 / DSM 21960 / TBF 19.5.1) TaxID=521045 RepID=C5CHL3_KOSOT|nr:MULTISPECIES: hypothetical protein [Kosmotoga]ACR79768.1 hypothetical protein Kole_1065 [Kosmotoga olearia TBF 19.5.1]